MAKIQNYLKINQIYQSVYFTLTLDTREQIDKLDAAIRVSHNKKTIYLRSGIKYTVPEFEKVMKGTKGDLYEKKMVLINFFNKVFSIAKIMIDEDQFTLLTLKNRVFNKNSETLDQLFSEKIIELEKQNKIKSAIMYRSTYNKLKEYHKNEIPLQKLNAEFVTKFVDEIKQNLSITTVGIYLRHLRHICNIALSRSLIKQSQYPFSTKNFTKDKVKIPRSLKRKSSFLDIETFTSLYKFYIEFEPVHLADKVKKQSLGIFIFSYLANGMNLADIAELTWSDHYFSSNGKELSFVRKKTIYTNSETTLIYVPVIDPLKKILDEHGSKVEKNKLIFPFILENEKDPKKRMEKVGTYNKNTAKRLKRIAIILDMNIEPTMTFARHSFQTNLAHMKVPSSYIDQAVGHSDKTITDTYIGMYSTKDRFKYNGLLLNAH